MSKAFIESFFPAFTDQIKYHYAPELYDWLLPDDVAVRCPEVLWTMQSDGDVLWSVRNPVLGIWASCGIVIGVYGFMKMIFKEPFLAAAFLAFSAMNATALPLHCFPYSSQGDDLWWSLDCLATGISSCCIICGWYVRVCSLIPQIGSTNDKPSGCGCSAQALVSVITLVAASALGIFLQKTRETLPLELFYLIPTAGAGVATAVGILVDSSAALLRRESGHPPPTLKLARNRFLLKVLPHMIQQSSIWLLLLGGSSVIVGLLVDAPLCRLFSPARWYGDALTVSTITFAGCDLAFLGLYQWLVLHERQSQR